MSEILLPQSPPPASAQRQGALPLPADLLLAAGWAAGYALCLAERAGAGIILSQVAFLGFALYVAARGRQAKLWYRPTEASRGGAFLLVGGIGLLLLVLPLPTTTLRWVLVGVFCGVGLALYREFLEALVRGQYTVVGRTGLSFTVDRVLTPWRFGGQVVLMALLTAALIAASQYLVGVGLG